MCQAVNISGTTGMKSMRRQEFLKTGCSVDLEAVARNTLPFARGMSNRLVGRDAILDHKLKKNDTGLLLSNHIAAARFVPLRAVQVKHEQRWSFMLFFSLSSPMFTRHFTCIKGLCGLQWCF